MLLALLRFLGKSSTCFEVASDQWKCGVPASMSEVVKQTSFSIVRDEMARSVADFGILLVMYSERMTLSPQHLFLCWGRMLSTSWQLETKNVQSCILEVNWNDWDG